MKSFFTLALAACFAATVTAEAVLVLTDAIFQETIDNNKYVLVEFYAPWCGHCKALAPEYEKAAAALADFEPKVIIANMDATEEKDSASKFGVQGFPTLKWFVDGEAKEYGGGRTEATIVNWIKKRTGPAAVTIVDAAALEALKTENEVVAVGIFATDADAEVFLKAAADEEEVTYALSVGNAEVAAAAGIESGVIVFQQFDDGSATFDGDATSAEAIFEFVGKSSLPLIIPFTQTTAPKIFGGAIKNHVLIFIDEEDTEATAAIIAQVKPVATEFAGYSLFVTVDKSEDRILQFFDIDAAKDIPTTRIVQMGEAGMKKFKLAGDITTEALTKFVNDFKEDKLSADLKSEEPIPEAEQGNVYVLTGKDFDEIVNKPGTDVLVEFYAPWCGHCKKLAPIWDEVGEHFADNANIIIAKMDSTANEVDSVQVSGFPTLKFFPADSDVVEDFEGAREKDDIIKYIDEHKKSA